MNIYDVARMAGVSLSTASKALNGRKDVKEETRQRVVEVAKRINYHPSHLARGLAKKRTENIGLVTGRRELQDSIIVNPFYSRVVEGIEAECMVRNYNMLLSVQPYTRDSMPAVPKMVREKTVDGLLVLGLMPEAFLRELAGCGIPMVAVDSGHPGVATDHILIDNVQGGREAALHLVGLGHRRLGMIAGSPKIESFNQRRAAFEAACRELGAQVETLEGPHVTENWDWMLPMIKGEGRPTAVFCVNDNHAYRLLALAAREGLSVPRDFSLVGFDDIELAAMMQPPLTTMGVPKQELGRRAVQRLMRLIEEPGLPKETVRLPVELVVRQSSAPA